VYRIGPAGDLRDPDDAWARSMGVSSGGAILIRPDGFVAWRSGPHAATPDDVEETLIQILGVSGAARPLESRQTAR
jgi:putative polyketide hydroxylase